MLEPSALETNITYLVKQFDEMKAAFEKWQGYCREDMRGVYQRIEDRNREVDQRLTELKEHAACQKGKELSTGKLVAIIGVVSMFVQGTFVMLQYLKG